MPAFVSEITDRWSRLGKTERGAFYTTADDDVCIHAACSCLRRRDTGTHLMISGGWASAQKVASRIKTPSGSRVSPGVVALAMLSLMAAIASLHVSFPLFEMVAVSLAAMIGALAGFAFSAICGAMLFHLPIDPVKVIQLMITCSIANQAVMTWSIRDHIDWSKLRVFLVGGIFGLPVGVWILVSADHDIYARSFGIFLFVYGAFMLLRKPVVLAQHRFSDFLAGLLGGVTGATLAFPSAPVTIWCSTKGLGKDEQRAIYQPFIFIMQIVALAIISLISWKTHMGPAYDWKILLCVPGSLLGTVLGMTFYGRLSDWQFARIVNVMLVISGLAFVI